MKKISLLIIMILLSSCSLFSKDKEDDVTKAKEELLGTQSINNVPNPADVKSWDMYLNENIEEDVKSVEPTAIATPLTTWNQLIEIEDLSNKDFYAWEFYINWKTLWVVDKIEVSFSNETSSYPVDLFKLKQYKVWDKNFKYMASSNFKTLDFWLNTYIFTAYSWDSTYKIKVEINIPEKEVKNPVNTEEAKLRNDTASITDIKNLKVIEDENVADITCNSDSLTKYLVENLGFSYWNSCLPIKKDKSIGFYVLRLEWDNYYYEKHYIDYDKKLHWTLLLETWTWVTKTNIKVKNYELKETSFDETLKADRFFKD